MKELDFTTNKLIELVCSCNSADELESHVIQILGSDFLNKAYLLAIKRHGLAWIGNRQVKEEQERQNITENSITKKQTKNIGYHQNDGTPGVVYILSNPGLRRGLYKIGCSSRSGKVRADELNRDASTGTPGIFQCIYEHKTLDCGRAEKRVHEYLSDCREGKRGQEYFRIDLKVAKLLIEKACKEIDKTH